jgi:hypothetical protein
MEQYAMKGGSPLVGEVEIGGAKNAALPILAASVMTDETVYIENMPDVRDTNVLLKAMGSYPLENYLEFYSHHEFLWSCSPWGIPRYRRKLGDKIELQVYYDHLEYDISDEYSPYEG